MTEISLLYRNINFVHALQGAADWCGRQKNCPISQDPSSKIWREGSGWEYTMRVRQEPRYAWRGTYRSRTSYITKYSRDKMSSGGGSVPVYITEGHYDDQADQLMDHVKAGGGLIVGGHAWLWSLHAGQNVCSLMEHPGNKIIVRSGIAFSRDAIEVEDNSQFQIDKVPALKSSLYFSLKCQSDRPEEAAARGLVATAAYSELHEFPELLRTVDCLKHLNSYLEYFDTSKTHYVLV